MKISIKVTVPQKRFSDKAFVDAITEKMRNKTIPDLKKIFNGTVEGWQKAPDFNSRQWHDFNEIGSEVFADGEQASIYAYISEGTGPRDIVPKNGGFMRFQPGYTASTSPGSLKSGPNKRFGGFMRARIVKNHVIRARDFPGSIKRDYEDTFVRDMKDAMGEGAKS